VNNALNNLSGQKFNGSRLGFASARGLGSITISFRRRPIVPLA
jgi:hypothetical protein